MARPFALYIPLRPPLISGPNSRAAMAEDQIVAIPRWRSPFDLLTPSDETMRTCSGEWTDCVTALALCRQLLAYQSRDLVRIKDGLETVARIWGKNRANGA